MMKKKILILNLAFVFMVSTTGLPVTYHLCKMMEAKSVSECGMCKIEMQKLESSCCSENVSDNSIIIKSEKSTCCQDEFVFNKVEDEFVNNKSNVNIFSSSEILFQQIVLIPFKIDFSFNESFYWDTSPPFLIDSDLYITNSVLLI